jgi:predicted nucleic acid-binding protein
MRLVVDASVAVKWYVDEPLSGAARQLLDDDHHLIGPEHLLAEVGQALWRRFYKDELSQDRVLQIVEVLPDFFELIPTEALISDAVALACARSQSVYDCLYVAAAVQEDALLVTADLRLVRAMAGSVWYERIRSLEHFAQQRI